MATRPQDVELTNDPTVSKGGQFTPEVRAFLDLIARREVIDGEWKDPSKSYYNNNGTNRSKGHFPPDDIDRGGGFPASAVRQTNQRDGDNIGRYQFNSADFEAAQKYWHKQGVDIKFDPPGQDLVAYWTLTQKQPVGINIPKDLERGDVRGAIYHAGVEWASLPGARAGGGAQVPKGYTYENAIEFYNQRLAIYKTQEQTQGQPQQGTQTPDKPAPASSTPSASQTTAAGGGLDDKLLVKGEDGAGVKRLQEALNAAGVRVNGQPLPTTGHFGDQTEAAVKQYQQQKGLEADGKAGKDTLSALGIYPGQTQTTPTPSPQTPSQSQPQQPAPQPQTTPGGHTWPAPGNYTVNRRDKDGEGDGEFNTSRGDGSRRHKGIDIQGKVGDPIESFGPGKVIFSGQMKGYGNTVVIQHDNGLQTLYGHLNSINVQERQRVTEDTVIGTMGRSGNTPAKGDTHLHFEVRENTNGVVLGGQAVDPRKYLEFPPRTLLMHSDQGPDVKHLQEALNAAGVRVNGQPLPTTGYFGDQTEAAVKQYQQQKGLQPVDGKAGHDTLTALGIYPGQQQTTPTPQPTTQQTPAQPPQPQTPDQQPSTQPPTQQAPTQQQPTQQAPTQQAPTQQTPAQQTPAQPPQPQTPDQQPSTQQPTQQAPAQQQPTQQQPTQQQPTQQAPTQQAPSSSSSSSEHPPTPQQPQQSPAASSDKPSIADPKHPDHRLYEQAMANLQQLGPSGGFKSQDELTKAAAAVAADARASGLNSIDHVAKTNTPNGQTLLVAVEGNPMNPASKNSYIDYGQATTQTVEQSTRMAEATRTQPQATPTQQHAPDHDQQPKAVAQR